MSGHVRREKGRESKGNEVELEVVKGMEGREGRNDVEVRSGRK
jgi:hypothetical protein